MSSAATFATAFVVWTPAIAPGRAGSRMTDALELAIKGDIRRLRLKPGDTVVVRVERDLTELQVNHASRALRLAFPDNPCLVLTAGASLEVVEP